MPLPLEPANDLHLPGLARLDPDFATILKEQYIISDGE